VQEGGRWQVSGGYLGHEASVEDLQWSPTEETVLASCSVDKTLRVWDTRERSKPMITVQVRDRDAVTKHVISSAVCCPYYHTI
jgi:ribosome assembly protein RRB1